MAYNIFNAAKNLAQSSLAAPYTAGATTLTVQTGDGAKFDSPNFVIALNNPPDFFLRVTGVTGDVFTVDTTGFDSTTPVNEASNIQVTEVIPAGVLQSLLQQASTNMVPNAAASVAIATVPQTGWTLQNASNAHQLLNDFLPNEIVMSAGNYGTAAWAAMTRGVLGGTYTIVACFQVRGQTTGATATFIAGIGVSDGTKYEAINIVLATGSNNILLEVRTLSSLNTGGTQITVSGNTVGFGTTVTVKIVNDATHRTFYYWANGGWTQFYQEASGTFLTETIAAVVALCDVGSGGYSLDTAIKYWNGA